MILQALEEYYENLLQQGKVAKAGWCQAKVSHVIELNEDRNNKRNSLFETRRGKREKESLNCSNAFRS